MFLFPFKFLKKTKKCPQICLDNDTGGEPIPEDMRRGDSRASCSPVAQEFITGGVRHSFREQKDVLSEGHYQPLFLI